MIAKIFVIGHSGLGYTAASLLSNTTSTCAPTPILTNHSYTITNNYCEPRIYIDYERWLRIAEIDQLKAGWLKPHKQLKPFNKNTIINYNLSRSRVREKKEIFLKVA